MGLALFLPNCWSEEFIDHEARAAHTWLGRTEFGKRVTIAPLPPEIHTTRGGMSVEENVRMSKVALESNPQPKGILRRR